MTSLVLPACLTHDQAAAFAKSLGVDIQAMQDETVYINATSLEKFDSSALAVLLQCRRDALLFGKNLRVIGLPARLHELANLYGIGELLIAKQEVA